MPHVKTQVVLQGATNVPEDRFITTWHFNTGLDFSSSATNIHIALAKVIGTTTEINANGLHQYLSEFVLRPFEMRHYDMTQAQPRVPIISTAVLPAYAPGSSASDLPEEVAACLSFHGDAPVTSRTRGRVFWGPLNTMARTDASTGAPVRTSDTFQTQAANALTVLAGDTVNWSVYSPTGLTLTRVTGGFIDNALDTQRRRGPKTTARTVWGVV